MLIVERFVLTLTNRYRGHAVSTDMVIHGIFTTSLKVPKFI